MTLLFVTLRLKGMFGPRVIHVVALNALVHDPKPPRMTVLPLPVEVVGEAERADRMLPSDCSPGPSGLRLCPGDADAVQVERNARRESDSG